jgi:hypothetical protein
MVQNFPTQMLKPTGMTVKKSRIATKIETRIAFATGCDFMFLAVGEEA